MSPERKLESPTKDKTFIQRNRTSVMLSGIKDHLSRQLDPMFKDKPKNVVMTTSASNTEKKEIVATAESVQSPIPKKWKE